ncbi:MAG: hypothetical protein ACMXYD_01795 [Candidatus Woesearchaeota archaeon]
MSAYEELLLHSEVINQAITTYVVTPLLIFFVGLALAALLRNTLRAALEAVQLDTRVRANTISLTNTIANIAFVLAAILAAILALASIEVLGLVLSRLAFLIFWLGLLALLLALTDAIRNRRKKDVATRKYPLKSTYKKDFLEGVVKKHAATHLVLFSSEKERVHVPYVTAAR